MRTPILLLMLIITGQLTAQQASKSILGNVNFKDLLNSVPVLQTSPEEAFDYACNRSIYCAGESELQKQYDIFNQKKEQYSAQLQANFAPQVDEFNAAYSEDGYKKLAEENAMIKSMGGMDKAMQMTEKEREVAAKKAMASQLSSSKTGMFTEEELQKMMNDPAYAKQMAAKYNNMSEAEKQAMVHQKIAKGDYKMTKEMKEEYEKERELADNTQMIKAFEEKTNARIMTAVEAFKTKVNQLRSATGSHDDLDRSYKELYDKIPMLYDVVEGKYKDPVKVKELKMSYALKHKDRATFELSEVQAEHSKLKVMINEVIAEYQSFLKTNGHLVKGKVINLMNGTNTEFSLLSVEQHIIGSIDMLAGSIKTENELASKQEQYYQTIKNLH